MSSTFEFDPRMNRRQLLRAGAGGALGLYGLGALAGCTVERPIDKPESTAAVKPEIDGDLLLFNWAQYMDPDIKKRFSEKYGVEVNEVNFDNLEAMVTKLRAGRPLRHHLADAPSTRTASTRRGCSHRFDRDSLNNANGISSFYDHGWWDPDSELLGSLHLLHDRDRLAQRRGRQRDDRFLERPDEPGRGGQDVHPRRLPGGDRRGEPDQRLANSTPPIRTSSRSRRRPCSTRRSSRAGSRRTRPRTSSTAPPPSTRPGTATSSTSATRSTTPRTSATRPARRACRSGPT